jgi:hypothetical protein
MFSNIAVLEGMKWYLIVILISICLTVSNTELFWEGDTGVWTQGLQL